MFFFFNDTATTEIYTLSLHDALPISTRQNTRRPILSTARRTWSKVSRSEEHTSELQSHDNLVCRLLLEKKNSRHPYYTAGMPHIAHPDARLPSPGGGMEGRGRRPPRTGGTAWRGLFDCFFFFKDRPPPSAPPLPPTRPSGA